MQAAAMFGRSITHAITYGAGNAEAVPNDPTATSPTDAANNTEACGSIPDCIQSVQCTVAYILLCRHLHMPCAAVLGGLLRLSLCMSARRLQRT